MSKRATSSGDTTRQHPYLVDVRIESRAKIIRKNDANGLPIWVQCFVDGVLKFSSKPDQIVI